MDRKYSNFVIIVISLTLFELFFAKKNTCKQMTLLLTWQLTVNLQYYYI